jgi:transcriptional regulator with XRE-family HTH domain
MSLYETIGERIRQLRERDGLSQEQLAKKLGEAANTISRWETATYKPSLADLEKLSRVFKDVSLTDFLPEEHLPPDQGVAALLRSAKALHKDDMRALKNYADLLRTARAMTASKSAKRRRKTTK